MKKSDLRKLMKRAWEIKNENEENIFSLCLKKAWEEHKRSTLFENRVIKRRIKYSVFKKAEKLVDGVNMSRGEYHAEDKTIDIVLTFDSRFFLFDSLTRKTNEELKKAFMETADDNVLFSCEVEERAKKQGVTDLFVLRNCCDIDADGYIEQKREEALRKGREERAQQYTLMKRAREGIFCLETI